MKRFAAVAFGAIVAANGLETEVPEVAPEQEIVEQTEQQQEVVEQTTTTAEETATPVVEGEVAEEEGEDAEEGEDDMEEGEGEEEQGPQEPALKTTTLEELPSILEKREQMDAIYVFEGAEEVKKAAADAADGMGPYAQVYHIEGSTSKLTVHRGIDETQEYESDKYDFESIKDWAVSARLPYFGEIGADNAQLYFSSGKTGMMWLCLNKETMVEDAKVAAKEMQQFGKENTEYPVAYFDMEAYKEHAEALGCTANPTIVLERGFSEDPEVQQESFKRSFAEEGAKGLTVENLKKFYADIASGELKAEPKPEPPTEEEELNAMDDEEVDGEEEEEAATAEEEAAVEIPAVEVPAGAEEVAATEEAKEEL